MALTALTIDDLYNEIADLAREQGASDQETWDDIVEEVVEDHMDLGEIDLDEDTEAMKETLRSRWPEYKIEASREKEDEDAEEEDVEIEGLETEDSEDEADDYSDGRADY